jgi:predicted CopG family antitoxin
MEESTILIRKDIIEKLKETKEYPRQTYNELLEKLIAIYLGTKRKNQYDEFLHKIQQPKMKELWDNKEDEAWENA